MTKTKKTMYSFVRLERIYVQTRDIEFNLDDYDGDLERAEEDISQEWVHTKHENIDTFIYEPKEIMGKLDTESSLGFFDDVNDEKKLKENLNYFLSGYEDLDNKINNV